MFGGILTIIRTFSINFSSSYSIEEFRKAKMKCTIFFALALVCCLGVALANWGYGGATYVPVYAGAGRSGAGNGSFIGLIGMLFLLFVLFGFGSNSNSDQIVLLNSTLEG